MIRIWICALILMASSFSARAQLFPLKMVQCESCSNTGQLKAVATSKGDGAWAIFSISHDIIGRYTVSYEPELHRYVVATGTVPPEMMDAFQLMRHANQLRPTMFSGATQVIVTDINNIGGGKHNPVEISLNGEQDDAYGGFMFNLQSCLSSAACATRLDPALGDFVDADWLLTGLGIDINGNGGSMQWENLPPGFQIWLCDDNDDCALVEFNHETNKWEYKETRGERGQGKRYPRYNETVNYKFNNSGEAGLFQRGLTQGGATVHGVWEVQAVLACTSAGGGIEVCEYVTVIQ